MISINILDNLIILKGNTFLIRKTLNSAGFKWCAHNKYWHVNNEGTILIDIDDYIYNYNNKLNINFDQLLITQSTIDNS